MTNYLQKTGIKLNIIYYPYILVQPKIIKFDTVFISIV